jgi:hypothetical protein
MWIVQEFLLCSRTVVHVGLRVVDALPFSVIGVSLMGNTLDHLKGMKTIGISYFAGTGVVFLAPDKLLASSRGGQFDDLQMMLNRFREQNCFDSRDYVYGILGLIGGSQIDGGIAIDYDSHSLFLSRRFPLNLQRPFARLGQRNSGASP